MEEAKKQGEKTINPREQQQQQQVKKNNFLRKAVFSTFHLREKQ